MKKLVPYIKKLLTPKNHQLLVMKILKTRNIQIFVKLNAQNVYRLQLNKNNVYFQQHFLKCSKTFGVKFRQSSVILLCKSAIDCGDVL